MRGYIRDFVEDPTETAFYGACTRLKSESYVVEQVISETESRADEIGQKNADVIVNNLRDLIDSIDRIQEIDLDEDEEYY